jgi:hypothetical protein
MIPLLTRHRNTCILFALAGLATLLYFVGLGAHGLFDADEPAYAQAAREMGERGDWVTPTFNGRPRFDKPALFYWLILASYALFGVTEFAVRCWSALAGVGVTLFVAAAARRWFGPPADLWAGLAFSTSLLTALLARAAVTDMLLTLCVTGAILAGLEAMDGGEDRGRRWARLLWIGMGLAVLVKGPVGLLIPALALGPMLLLRRELRAGIRRLAPWEGPVLLLLLVAPWYALVLAANGWAFIEGFILKHHLTRYAGVVSSHAGPVWFYLPVLLVGFFPWSAYLPAALWRAWRAVKAREVAPPPARAIVACASWVVGVFLFFSLAGTKLPSYLFPAFPAMALLVGGLGGIQAVSITDKDKSKPTTDNRQPTTDNRQRRTDNGEPTTENGQPINAGQPEAGRFDIVGCQFSIGFLPRWIVRLTPWLFGIVGYALAVGFGLIPWILERARPAARGVLDGVAPPTGLAVLLAALLLFGTTAGLVLRGSRRAGALAAMMAGLILLAGAQVAPRAHAILQGALQDFALEARRTLPPDGALVVYGLNAPSIVFYADRPAIPLGVGDIEPVRAMAAAGRPMRVIARHTQVEHLRAVPGLGLIEVRGGYALFGTAAAPRPPSR